MAKGDGLERRLLVMMLAAGATVGAIFPAFASIFATAKSPFALLMFGASCVLAGLGLGYLCYVVSTRTSEGVLMDVSSYMSATLGMELPAARGIEDTSRELRRFCDSMEILIGKSRDVADRMKSFAADTLAAAEEQASGAAQQAAAVTETSATVEELALTSRQIAENSEAVVKVAENTLAAVEEGMDSVAETVSGIEDIRTTTQQSSDRILALGDRSKKIGRVLVIIDEIAEQTKILALNAAIEAARAGEAGKGFAVVAEEIRKLADSVTESTQDIGKVLGEIQASTSALVMSTERAGKKVDEGKDLSARTATVLERIVEQMEETTDAAKQISVATQQQRSASEQVVVSMREVATVSRQSAESSRQISGSILELNNIAESLRESEVLA